MIIKTMLMLMVMNGLVYAQSSDQAVAAVGSFSDDLVKLLQGPVVKVVGALVLLGGVAALLRGKQQIALAIGLAVITVLILSISLSSGLRNNARVQSAAQSIQALRSAAESYVSAGHLNYNGLSIATLKANNLLPANFDNSSANPWGGAYLVAANANNNTMFDIALTAVPKEDSPKLAAYFQNNASAVNFDESKGEMVVTF